MAKLSVTGCGFFVCILFLSVSKGTWSKQLSGRMSGIKYKPIDAGMLYNIPIANEDSCIAVCIQHPACVMSLYRQADSSRCGYRTNYTTDIQLEEDVKTWQITYQGCSHLRSCLNGGWCIESEDGSKCNCPSATLGDHCQLVNVATHADIRPYMQCKASSTINSEYSCNNTYDDGPITESYGNDWGSNYEGTGAWIEIEGPCDGGNDWSHCEQEVGFQQFALTPPRIITWIKLTVLETCVRSPGCLGFREIKCFGQFP